MSRKSKYPKVKKNGSEYYRARIPNPYVKSGYSDVYAKTVRELDQKKKEKEKQIQAGIIDANTTFGAYFEKILETKLLDGLKDSTRKTKAYPIRLIRESSISKIRLVELNPPLINNWLASLDLSKGAYTSVGTLLRNTLQSAFKDGLIYRNLSESVELPKVEGKTHNKREGRLLSNLEVTTILDSLKEPYKTLSAFLLDTGVRVGEALALDWTDIDFDNKTVSITKAMGVRTHKITTPKNKTSVRTVPLSDSMISVLKQLRLNQRETALKFPGFYEQSNAVFRNESGNRISYDTYLQHLKRTGADVKPHDFRHTNASRLNESGVSPLVVAKWLGHSKIDTTVNVYTDVTENLEKSSLELLNGAKIGAK